MKKYLALLLVAMSVATVSKAAIVLDEPFAYLDGALTNVSGGKWSIHSGTTPINVVNQKAVISQTNNQDNNAQLIGAPYSSGNLYAIFIINFSTVPTGGGSYFAHFKDATTSGFRCRAYAVSTGAAAGNYRVGIARSGGAAVIIPTDLLPNTDYTLVMRYDAATGASRLWINPQSEGAVSDFADGTDAWTATPITSFGLRQGTTAGTSGTTTLDDLKVGTAFTDVVAGGNPALNPPFMSSIPSQSIPRSSVTPAVPFYVTDGETAFGALTLSAASTDTALVPVGNIAFTTDGGSNRTVTVSPVAGAQGFSKITVTVTDGDNNTAARDFLVIVGAPTISAFTNVEIAHDTATTAIPFTIGDAESDTLTLSATSTNGTLVPVGNVTFGGSGANRTVTVTPAAGLNGLSRITISVSDGFNTASNSFVITVFPTPGPIFSDTFTYPDGSLNSQSSFVWNTTSGSNGQMQVLSGKVLLSGTNTEDVAAFLGVSSYPPHQGWILYASFTVDFKRRPSNSGNYFAHFRNVGGSFGARVFSVTNGAAPGKYRLGLANSSAAPSVVWPTDLDTNVTYTVVTRMNVGTGASRLWVSPASEASASIAATDSAFPFEVFTYAFREDFNIGDMLIDDFKCSTAFSDVVEIKPVLTINATGNNVTLSWPASAAAAGYVLRFTDSFPAAWADFFDQGNPQGDQLVVTLNGVTDNRFFELRKP